MRESQGATFLFQIVIVFVLLFTGYLCLSINYARAFRVKDELINIFERNKGVNPRSIDEAYDYLNQVGYRTTGKCENDTSNGIIYHAYVIENKKLVNKQTSGDGNFCMRQTQTHVGDDEYPERIYYTVQVFYRLDLPIFNNFFVFKVSGDSYQISNPIRN